MIWSALKVWCSLTLLMRIRFLGNQLMKIPNNVRDGKQCYVYGSGSGSWNIRGHIWNSFLYILAFVAEAQVDLADSRRALIERLRSLMTGGMGPGRIAGPRSPITQIPSVPSLPSMPGMGYGDLISQMVLGRNRGNLLSRLLMMHILDWWTSMFFVQSNLP